MTGNCKEQQDSIHTGSIQWDSSWPELVEDTERGKLLSYLEERFGLGPALFQDYYLLRRRRTWWFIRSSQYIPKAAQLKIALVGLKAFTKLAKFRKPTTQMIQVFGNKASKACLCVNEGELRKLLSGETLSWDTNVGDGYVILKYEHDVLGLGLLINGNIRSQLPREYTDKLLKFQKHI